MNALDRLVIMFFLFLGASCTGTVSLSGRDGGSSSDGQTTNDGTPWDGGQGDAAHVDGALIDSSFVDGAQDAAHLFDAAPADASPPDAAVDAAVGDPLIFNIIFRQTVQACSGCGIWFDWQEVQSQKPRLVVVYDHLGQSHSVEYQHGLNGMDNAHSIFISPSSTGDKHSILVKQSPLYNGLRFTV